ncbi:S41 family peptidase [Pelomonas sp. SE-A7]|uniref:S41 family peptidase n=1 Tax=Pelomonas sp. SE-A7 TaxID=3054953 RepID=UPI00259C7AD9|nr:S41 family peptidase [Pelomonas sp. SE-A7]MDM4767234.1 S41 family peptidase [Pelomonas sp. SE-A7]
MAGLIEVAGNVQYFHPSDGVAATDWQDFYQYAMLRVSRVAGDAEYLALLRELFANVAPSVRFNEPGASYEAPAQASLLAWVQNGYTEDASGSADMAAYHRERVTLSASALGAAPGLPTAAQLRYTVQGIEVMQPLVQRSEGGVSLPKSSAFSVSQWRGARQFGEPAVCLAEMGRVWTVIRNFWPYHDTIKPGWSAELPQMLAACDPQVGADKAAANAARQLRLSLSKLQDNHVVLRSTLEQFNQMAPFVAQSVEGRTLIVQVLASGLGVQVGDELLSVDGVAVDELLRPMLAESTSSEHRTRSRLLAQRFLRSADARQYRLQLADAKGARREQLVSSIATTPTSVHALYSVAAGRPMIEKRADGLVVINLVTLDPQNLPAALAAMEQARAVVLDLRGYPVSWDAWWSVLARLASRPLQSLPMFEHRPVAPGPVVVKTRVPQEIEPASPRVTAPVVALSSPYCISQNEHVLGYVQSAGIAIIGEPTMGINGDITSMRLLREGSTSAGSITFTGLEVTQHDGSRLIGVGIQPTVLKVRTVQALREGRDEVLEAGLAYLKARL